LPLRRFSRKRAQSIQRGPVACGLVFRACGNGWRGFAPPPVFIQGAEPMKLTRISLRQSGRFVICRRALQRSGFNSPIRPMNPRAWVNAPSLPTSLGCNGLGLLPLSGTRLSSACPQIRARSDCATAGGGQSAACVSHASGLGYPDRAHPENACSGAPRPALNPFGMVPKRLSRGKARNPRFFEPWSCFSNYQTPGPRAPVFLGGGICFGC
jgi:hypothetical protein